MDMDMDMDRFKAMLKGLASFWAKEIIEDLPAEWLEMISFRKENFLFLLIGTAVLHQEQPKNFALELVRNDAGQVLPGGYKKNDFLKIPSVARILNVIQSDNGTNIGTLYTSCKAQLLKERPKETVEAIEEAVKEVSLNFKSE